MTSSMEFTDKAQQSLAEAIQLAKDYANAQGMSPCILFSTLFLTYIKTVHPAHLAFVLLNEGGATEPSPSGAPSHGGAPLFSSVVTKAGGDPVSIHTIAFNSLC
jgi:ATP-dependent Clp protease ATP-binding subunit ClpB